VKGRKSDGNRASVFLGIRKVTLIGKWEPSQQMMIFRILTNIPGGTLRSILVVSPSGPAEVVLAGNALRISLRES